MIYDFGVKYVEKQHAKHLMVVLKEDYSISHYWEGKRYLGLTLDWDYGNKEVMVSMLEYVKNALQRFIHLWPKKPRYQLHPHLAPRYGAKHNMRNEKTPRHL